MRVTTLVRRSGYHVHRATYIGAGRVELEAQKLGLGLSALAPEASNFIYSTSSF